MHFVCALNTHYDPLLIDNVEVADVSSPMAVRSSFNGELFVVYVVEDVENEVRLARSVDDGVTWGVTVVAVAGSDVGFVSPRIAVNDLKYEIVVVVYEKGNNDGRLRVWREVDSKEGFVEENEFLSGIEVSASDGIQDFVFGSDIYALVFASIDLDVQIVWTTDFVTYQSESASDDFDSGYPTMNYKLFWKENNYLVLLYSYRKNPAKSYLYLYYSQNMHEVTPDWQKYEVDSLDTPCTYSLISCSDSHWYIGYQCSGSNGYYTSIWGPGITPDDGSVTWTSRSFGVSSMEISTGGGCFNSVAYDIVSNSDGTSYRINAFDFSNSVSSTSTIDVSTNGANPLSFYGFNSGEHQISWVFPDPGTSGKERYDGVDVFMGPNNDLSIFSLIACIDNNECDSRADMCGKSCETHIENIKTCQNGRVENCLFQNGTNCGATCSGGCVPMSGVDCIQGDSSYCGRTCQVTGVCSKDGQECVDCEICGTNGICFGECEVSTLYVDTTEISDEATKPLYSVNSLTESPILVASETILQEDMSTYNEEFSSKPILQEDTQTSNEESTPYIFSEPTYQDTQTINEESSSYTPIHPEDTQSSNNESNSFVHTPDEPNLLILFVLGLILAFLIALIAPIYFITQKAKKKKSDSEKLELELQRIQQQSQQTTQRSITEQYFSRSNPSSSE